MQRYIVTAELLNAWQDYINDRDPSDRFRMILSGSPKREKNPVKDLIKTAAYSPLDYSTITYLQEIVNIIQRGTWDIPGIGSIQMDSSVTIIFSAIADVINGCTIYIIKPVNKWTPGMMSKNTQSAMLKSAFPEVTTVKYILLGQDKSVYTESYSVQDIPEIEPILSEFFDWIKSTDLFPLYQKKWRINE